MACCLLCFSDEPVEGDVRAGRNDTFKISMMDGLTMNQPVCCLTYCFPFCSAYYTRYRVLDGDLSRYVCCQGYMDNFCFRAGTLGERDCPSLCLCLESFICVGPGMSSSRIMMMDRYSLRSDPCDNRVIRLTNCLQILSCVCDILAIFVDHLRHLAHLIHVIAQIVFYSTVGCMAAQVNHEVDYRRATHGAYASIPTGEIIPDQVIYGQAEVVKQQPSK